MTLGKVLGGVALCLLPACLHGAPHPALGSGPEAPANFAPDSLDGIRFFTGDGVEVEVSHLLERMLEVEVILLGEVHDDPVGHRARHHLFRSLLEEGEEMVLSMEMFERDVQEVLDEYLAGLITEDQFLEVARPWPRYRSDYRPAVEAAREGQVPVVAANPPRRYVNRVTRLGPVGLDELPPEARRWLPPLPVAPPSEPYREESLERFRAAGEEHGHSLEGQMGENLLQAQNLWDAGMAHAIAETLLRQPETRIFHLAGRFHVARGTGIPEHLARYRPGTRMLTVVAYPVEAGEDFDPDLHRGQGDFVILTSGSESPHPGG